MAITTGLSRSGKRRAKNNSSMKPARKARRVATAESIAKLAERGHDVSRYFTNAGQLMPPLHGVAVNFSEGMLGEIDAAARELNVSREAAIKALVRQALDDHYLAQKARPAAG
jgi:hypothetical protein